MAKPKRASRNEAALRRHNPEYVPPAPKAAPKPTVVDRLPSGWAVSPPPPPRPVDEPSEPVNYRQFSIPAESGKGRMTVWARTKGLRGPDSAKPIPLATGKPETPLETGPGNYEWQGRKSGPSFFYSGPTNASVKVPGKPKANAPLQVVKKAPTPAPRPASRPAPRPISVRFAEPNQAARPTPKKVKPAEVHPVYAAAAAALNARKPTGARRKML